jgi:sortase A
LVEKTVQAEGNDKAVEEARNYGINPAFSIYIAKVKAKGNIIANVDITDTDGYLNVLKEGVAHARGTNFPGQGKNIYLFSHSTNSPLNVVRFNAIFNDLGKLEKGDLVTIFYSNKKYLYSVETKIVVASDDVTFLDKDFGGESLILQTCYPPGTTLKRLLIVAKPVDN